MTDNVQVNFSSDFDGLKDLNAGIVSHVNRLREANKEYEVVADKSRLAKSGLDSLASSLGNMNRQQAMTLQYTASDVVASLASGISPMTILLQQGGQVAQVFGSGSLAVMGFGAAIGGIGYLLYSFAANLENAAEHVSHINTVLDAQGRNNMASETIKGYVEELAKLPGVNTEAARSIVTELATATNISAEAFKNLEGIVSDYASVTGSDATKAAQALAKMSEDPARAADKLSDVYRNILTPAEYEQIQEMSKLGDKMGATDILAEALHRRFSGLAEQGMTPAQEGAHILGTALEWMGGKIADSLNVVRPLTEAVGHLAEAFRQLRGDDAGKAADEAKKQADLQAAINKPILEALQLRQKLQGSLDQESTLRAQLKTITDGYNNALVSGQEAEAAKLRETKGLIEQKIQKLDEQKRKEAESKQNAALEREDQSISQTAQVEQAKFQTVVASIQLAAAYKSMTLDQEFAQLESEREQEYEVEQNLLDRRLNLWGQGSEQYQRIVNEKLRAEQKFQQDILRLETQKQTRIEQLERQREAKAQQLRLKEQQEWKTNISSIVGTFGSAVSGMIKGQYSVLQAGQMVASGLLDAFVGYLERKAVEELMALIFGETTAKAEALASITADSARAGAAAYASTCAIPVIGPELAPAAAATASAATLAFGAGLSVPSAAGGWEVTHDTLAMVHEDEKILPADVSEKIDNMTSGGASSVTLHLSAIDGPSVKRFFERHGDKIADQILRQSRNNKRARR